MGRTRRRPPFLVDALEGRLAGGERHKHEGHRHENCEADERMLRHLTRS